jgi:hypothetical protein
LAGKQFVKNKVIFEAKEDNLARFLLGGGNIAFPRSWRGVLRLVKAKMWR